ncbi:hypothetical protein LSO07_12880 [Janthinobacterium sp. PLB04]|uniref:DUF1579 domain-containing protein n=1 Tax=Janthinobacterium lividum TaxID=29581 RepID=A0AAJ4T7X7_9BURK|nr:MULTISPECIES: hypothetical protein [Janthinobacterium]KAB0324627.1 hypothetical protein F3B38_12930 [Janthinobacterium lividum]QSX98732.1 hypothetical protein J3P46_13030 [Janthinobacterium lividum]UGQ38704.1 hypothetical protein LSO07_12880 [Janthinobacterium sp. PLB04]
MRPFLLSLLLLPLLLSTSAVLAQPIAALQPMAFLAGHCWKGEFPGGKQTDEHCFQWLYGGQMLRDVHTVRSPGKPDYVGETTYYHDPAAGKVAFLYVENSGGHSRGTMLPADGGLDFPATQYVGANGKTLTYRVRWTPSGDAYEAASEMLVDGRWAPQFKLLLKKQ